MNEIYTREDQELAMHTNLSLVPTRELGLGGLVREIVSSELLKKEKLESGIALDPRFKPLIARRINELYTCLNERERHYSDKSPMRIG